MNLPTVFPIRGQFPVRHRRFPGHRPRYSATWLLASLLLLAAAPPARAGQPFIWDDDGNGLDDRMETVHLLGYQFAFEGADSLSRQRFQVARVATDLVYGVYVLYKSDPGATEMGELAVLGMPVLHRFEGIPALRSLATFAQAQAARALPSVERIEVVPLLYPETREDAASAGVIDPTSEVFPTWQGSGGAEGEGIIVAILDTGVNDSPSGIYPGHESVAGRRVGGAEFTHGDSALDTPRDASEDPEDRGGSATHAHGTHMAGIVLGSGGASGYARGMAPAARFVDIKVLDDAGFGTGIAEAIDWCIHNRSRNWSLGAEWRGIDVINLSLSSLDESDGNDVQSRLASRAAELGIAVVASAGNDGADHHIPSPAAGDGVIAVGAYDAQRSPRAGDDTFASFSNQGPRASDGDLDSLDELKPDLAAPGVAVLSANGDLSSDGTQYRRMSGTSMAAAVVSGVIAALRSEFPALSPADIATLLRNTARRSLAGVPAGAPGSDPRWRAAIGWGALDLYAARLELLQPQRSQVRRLAIEADTAAIAVTIWTQRERGAAHFVLERASDSNGAPGVFAPLDSVTAAGDSSLSTTDLTPYTLTLGVPAGERGAAFWYRISYSEDGARHDTPARQFRSPSGASAATIRVRVIHDAYDHDLDARVMAGGTAGPAFMLPGTSASVSSEWVNGTSATGTIAWEFAIEVPAGVADAYLPPSSTTPWRLQVTDGGYVNRGGRIDSFRITWHAPAGDATFQGSPVPQPTIEGQAVQVTIAPGTAGVEASWADVQLRASPSPVSAGRSVRFVARGPDPGHARVFDLEGREIARVPFVPEAGHWVAWWSTAAIERGAPRAGVYFARAGNSVTRIVVLGP